MRIRFLGAAQEVTGAMFLLETARGSVLIDCGLFQGRREESRRRNRRLPKEALSAKAVILTHAHIDHSGSLPTLVKSGFRGSIHATPATRDLCSYMLRDAARIQEQDARYLNRKFVGEPDFVRVEPLYDDEDAIAALSQFIAVSYHRPFTPIAGVTATLLDAGHILGSAGVLLDVKEKGRTRRVLFSGDLGRKNLPIVRDPEDPPTPLDYVVMESTYGNRVHGDVAQMDAELERVLKATMARGGKIVIPAFAVGRTQELLFALHRLQRAGRLPDIPVFIDSPLAAAVTGVFRLHPECFDPEARAFVEQHGEVFDFQGVKVVTSREESMELDTRPGPAIIISASGMCEAGRVLHHLRHAVEDERNTILVIGFMAQHTLGRRLVERRPRVKVFGVERDLRARVEVLNAFSAHADRNDLLGYALACGPSTRRFFLVHGEPEQQEPLRRTMVERGLSVHVPARGEVCELQ